MIKDGKYLEDRSVALIKLEVDVLTVVEGNNFVHRRGVSSEDIEGTKIFLGPTIFNQQHTVNSPATFSGPVGISGAVNISGDVVMSGNVRMTGTVTQVNSTDLNISDNEIVVNSGESGAGITKAFAGIRIDRGSLANYLLCFREADDKLVAGLDGTTLKQVAFVDDINFSIPNAAGDVTGTIDDNTISQLQGIAVSASNPDNASILYYNGTAWVPVKVSDILPPGDIGEGSGLIAMNNSLSPAAGFAGAGDPMPYRQITFTPGLSAGTDYAVIITPIENTQAKVGEVWWEKANAPTEVQDTFRVYNTGDSGVSFKWGVFAVGMPVGVAPGTDISGNYSSDIKVVGLRGKELDVNVGSPSQGHVLTYTDGKWKAMPNSTSGSITPATQANGDVTGVFSSLKVGGINGKAIDDLTGRAMSPIEGDTLRFDGSKWKVGAHTLAGDVSGEHRAVSVDKIKNVPVDLSNPVNGKVLTYSDNKIVLADAASGGDTPTISSGSSLAMLTFSVESGIHKCVIKQLAPGYSIYIIGQDAGVNNTILGPYTSAQTITLTPQNVLYHCWAAIVKEDTFTTVCEAQLAITYTSQQSKTASIPAPTVHYIAARNTIEELAEIPSTGTDMHIHSYGQVFVQYNALGGDIITSPVMGRSLPITGKGVSVYIGQYGWRYMSSSYPHTAYASSGEGLNITFWAA